MCESIAAALLPFGVFLGVALMLWATGYLVKQMNYVVKQMNKEE